MPCAVAVSAIHDSAYGPACATLRPMLDYLNDTPEQRAQRLSRDLHDLRVLAWPVQRGRYSREPKRVEGGRRGKARIATFTFYVEPQDLLAAAAAVREAERWEQDKQRGGP